MPSKKNMRCSNIFFLLLCIVVTGLGIQLWFAPNITSPFSLPSRILPRISRPRKKVSKCKPVHNFAFLKTHKTGSTTLRSITTRFGYTRNLSFVLQDGLSIGHFNYKKVVLKGNKTNILPPIGVTYGDYKHYGGYNISNVHIRYNHSLYRQLMHPKSLYVSVLREPSSQWLSAFLYFRMYEFLPTSFTNMTDAVAEFMKKPQMYRNKSSYTWNNQLLDLGLDKVHFANMTKVMEHLKLLDKDLDLVLITEYFDESLLLLKKLFCWSLDDIVYIKQREQTAHVTVNDTLRRKILAFNRGDTLIYKHFLKIFWEKVKQYGPTFQRDLAEFRSRLKYLEKKCVSERIEKSAIDGRIYVHNFKKNGTGDSLCDMLVDEDFEIDNAIMKRQGQNNSRYEVGQK